MPHALLIDLPPSLDFPERLTGESSGRREEERGENCDSRHDGPTAFNDAHDCVEQLNECDNQ